MPYPNQSFPDQAFMDKLGLSKAEKAMVCSLHAMGYRRTSRSGRIITRVDHRDWLLIMAHDHFNDSQWAYYAGPDHYRGCYSCDKLVMPTVELMRAFCTSGHDDTGHKEMSKRLRTKLKNLLAHGLKEWDEYMRIERWQANRFKGYDYEDTSLALL